MAETDKRYTVMVYFTDGASDLNEDVKSYPIQLDGMLTVVRTDGEQRHYVLRNVQFYTVEPQA